MIAAVVPAAGRSKRMGRPKLLLPLGGRPLIVRVAAAIANADVAPVVVVAATREVEGAAEIVRLVSELPGVTGVHLPAHSEHMRDSIRHGLDHLFQTAAPTSRFTGLLLTPGDSVGITSDLVTRVIDVFREDASRIVVPCYHGKGGHPVILPWDLAERIPALPEGVGVNFLVAENVERVRAVETEEPEVTADLDTRDDYEHWRNRIS